MIGAAKLESTSVNAKHFAGSRHHFVEKWLDFLCVNRLDIDVLAPMYIR